MLPSTPTQHYLVLSTLQRKYPFLRLSQFSKLKSTNFCFAVHRINALNERPEKL